MNQTAPEFPRSAPAWGTCALLLLFIWLGPDPVRSQMMPKFKDEYEAKGVFLYKFAQYTTWQEASAASNSTFVVGILGADPWKGTLTKILIRPINGKTVVVKQLDDVKEAEKCHLLFISKSEKNNVKQILSQLANKPVLTVGETDKFTQMGGMIYCYVDQNDKDNYPRFELNAGAAARAKLSMNTDLLKGAAHIIH